MIITLVSQICKHVLLLFSSQQITPTTTPSHIISLNYYKHPIQELITLMRNAGLEETQAGIKIAGRNINNLRYADDTTLMAESEEELKSLLMK